MRDPNNGGFGGESEILSLTLSYQSLTCPSSAQAPYAPLTPPLPFRKLLFMAKFDLSHPPAKNSVYGCFPFFTPQKMKDSLTKQKIADRYTFTRPVATPVPKILNTFTGIKAVLNDPTKFNVAYEMSRLGDGYGFLLSFDDAVK